MITFHSQQSDFAQRARKNENGGTVNFITQIAPSICTVMHTKRVKTEATIFKSLCSRTVVCYRLYRVQALPLSFVRFLRLANSSPKIQRSPARRSHNVREPSHKKSGEMSRFISARFPGNGRTVANTMPPNFRAATCKTTHNMPRNGHAMSASQSAQQTMQHPVKHLTGRLVEIFSSRF